MPSSELIVSRQQRIADQARRMPGVALTSLNHHLDMALLREAYRQTRKDGAVGVDGVTAAAYEQALEDNLQNLLDRAKSGTYRAPPVRRVYIPKAGGGQRPLGIPTFEDKILQRAVLMILEPVYEQEFRSSSYGFRPGLSAHDAIEGIRDALMSNYGGYVLDADIQKFFDTLDKPTLLAFVRQRIRDGVLLRLIAKWLRAGVLEAGRITHPATGTPQGGVISPLLANIYLHEVLDKWFEDQVRPQLSAPATLVRYADDFVVIFARVEDAYLSEAALSQRLGAYGLRLHPGKTRLVKCWPQPKTSSGAPLVPHETRSFRFLGFTFCWGRSLKGKLVVRLRTAPDRLSRAAKRVWDWCRRHRHDPIREQHRRLSQALRGHDAYYGVTGNFDQLSKLRSLVSRSWFYWLRRRGQRRPLTWAKFRRMSVRYRLPPPRIVHSVMHLAANP